MSFHEKSAWACLISILLVFVPYFWVVFPAPAVAVGLLPLATIVLVVLLTAFHVVNALTTRSIRKLGDAPPQDELERMIELRAAKLSGFVLAFAVMSWCLLAMYTLPFVSLGEGVQAQISDAVGGVVNQALTAVQLLFAGFVVANIAYYGSIVVGYRRLVHG